MGVNLSVCMLVYKWDPSGGLQGGARASGVLVGRVLEK